MTVQLGPGTYNHDQRERRTTMTPTEALAQALDRGFECCTTHDDIHDDVTHVAEVALAALPEGWGLIETDPYGTLADFRRRVEKEERERLRAEMASLLERVAIYSDPTVTVSRRHRLYVVADWQIDALLSDPEPSHE